MPVYHCTSFLLRKILILFFLIPVLQSNSQSKKDSLWRVWKDTDNADTTRLMAIGHLCSNYYWHPDPDSSIILADMEYDLAKKKNLKNFMGVALLKKAGGYSFKGDHVKSLYYSQQGLKLFKELGHESGIASSLSNIGQDYMSLGNYSDAVHNFYEGLKYFEKTNNKRSQVQTYSNIANAYRVSGRLDSAIRINKLCLKICEDIKSNSGIAMVSGDLAGIYIDLFKYEEGLYYAQKSAILNKENGSKHGLAEAYFNIGKIYLAKTNYTRAEYYFEKSISISKLAEDYPGMAAAYLKLSALKETENEINEALSLAEKGMELLKGERVPGLTYELTSHLAKLQEKKGNYKEALALNKISIKERDSTNNASIKNALYQEQLKYDFEKKELLAKSEHEKNLNALRAEAERKDFRKNLWLTGSIALLFILLLSGYFFFHNLRQKNIINGQKNNLLKQQLLVSQMNPHFIFNSLTAIQNFIFRQDSLKAGIYLKKFSELIRMILDFSRKDVISLSDEFTFLQNYLELQKLRFDTKFNYELKFDPQLEMDMVMIPPMLAQPFIENAIEHGIFYKNGKGFLSINIFLKNNTLFYEIEDDGIGMEESLKLKKTMNKHQSLAIQITKERIETMNAQNHTHFEIEIRDKGILQKETSGVYVKFATPYLTL